MPKRTPQKRTAPASARKSAKTRPEPKRPCEARAEREPRPEPEIAIQIGVPLPKRSQYQDLKYRVDAFVNTEYEAMLRGEIFPPLTQRDREAAVTMVAEYAEDEEAASKKYSNAKLARMQPEAVRYAKALLDEYGHRAVKSVTQIRNYVTTRLVHETENPDPRIRMKALELLGKISDVGLFTDKTEVTVTHQTSDELRQQLRSKLEKLVNPDDPVPELKDMLVPERPREGQARVIEHDD